MVASQTQIDLTWTDNSGGLANEFCIEQASDAAFTQQVSNIFTSNVTSFSVTGLDVGTTYYFRVCAYVGACSSSYSNSAWTTTKKNAVVIIPAPAARWAETALTASDTSINLTWMDKSGDESGFQISESTDGTDYSVIGAVGAGAKFKNIAGQAGQ